MSSYTSKTYTYVVKDELSPLENSKALVEFITDNSSHLILDEIIQYDDTVYSAFLVSKYNKHYGIEVGNRSNNTYLYVNALLSDGTFRTTIQQIYANNSVPFGVFSNGTTYVAYTIPFVEYTIGENVLLHMAYTLTTPTGSSVTEMGTMYWFTSRNLITNELIPCALTQTYGGSTGIYSVDASGSTLGTMTITQTGGTTHPTTNYRIAAPIIGGSTVSGFYGYIGGSNPLYTIYSGGNRLSSGSGLVNYVGGHTFMGADKQYFHIMID